MKNTLFGLIALCFMTSAFAADLTPKSAYSKASGYTGLKKSLIYQALGNKRYRRLV